jgi:hypothetical protein
MWIAAVLQKQINNTKADWTMAASFIGDKATTAAAPAEKYAAQYRSGNNTMSYQVVVAEVSKRIKPPDENIVLEDYTL